jgi:DNA-binding XRE family transcriptional regulator
MDNREQQKSPGESGLYNRIAVLRAERGDYSPSLKLGFALAAYFHLPVEALFATEPFQPLSQQVYKPSYAPAQPKQPNTSASQSKEKN